MTKSTKTLTKKSALCAGNYALNVTINDSSNNINWTTFIVTVAKINPTGTITNNETFTETYPTELIIGLSESNTGDADLTYKIYRDNSLDIGTGETISLAAGTYNYTLNSTGGQNYSSIDNMESQTLTINSAVPVVSLAVTASITFGHAGDDHGH